MTGARWAALPPPEKFRTVKARLVQAIERESRAGTPYLAMTYRVIGTQHVVWDAVPLIDRARWRGEQLRGAFHRRGDHTTRCLDEEAVNRWIGRDVWLEIRYEGDSNQAQTIPAGWRVCGIRHYSQRFAVDD